MKLLTLDDGALGAPAVMLSSGDILNLREAALITPGGDALPQSLVDLFRDREAGLRTVRDTIAAADALGGEGRAALFATGALAPPTAALMPVVPRPSLILAAGLAYRSHLAEMANTPTPKQPTGFLKAPSSLSASGASVIIPKGVEKLDFEGELAVIFARQCHRVSVEEAFDYVAGYAPANDLSARDWVQAVWDSTQPWEARVTWEVNIMGKQFPGFTGLGPVMATTEAIPDPSSVVLTTRVNGQVMQEAPVSDLIFSIPEMIAYFSHWYAFSPGDVLLTGTPAGVGVGRKPPVFLKPGDMVEVEASSIGVLTTTIVSDNPASKAVL